MPNQDFYPVLDKWITIRLNNKPAVQLNNNAQELQTNSIVKDNDLLDFPKSPWYLPNRNTVSTTKQIWQAMYVQFLIILLRLYV